MLINYKVQLIDLLNLIPIKKNYLLLVINKLIKVYKKKLTIKIFMIMLWRVNIEIIEIILLKEQFKFLGNKNNKELNLTLLFYVVFS